MFVLRFRRVGRGPSLWGGAPLWKHSRRAVPSLQRVRRRSKLWHHKLRQLFRLLPHCLSMCYPWGENHDPSKKRGHPDKEEGSPWQTNHPSLITMCLWFRVGQTSCTGTRMRWVPHGSGLTLCRLSSWVHSSLWTWSWAFCQGKSNDSFEVTTQEISWSNFSGRMIVAMNHKLNSSESS